MQEDQKMMLIMFNWELLPALRRLECISSVFFFVVVFSPNVFFPNLYEKQKCSMFGFRDEFRCFTCVSAAKTKQCIFLIQFFEDYFADVGLRYD